MHDLIARLSSLFDLFFLLRRLLDDVGFCVVIDVFSSDLDVDVDGDDDSADSEITFEKNFIFRICFDFFIE